MLVPGRFDVLGTGKCSFLTTLVVYDREILVSDRSRSREMLVPGCFGVLGPGNACSLSF